MFFLLYKVSNVNVIIKAEKKKNLNVYSIALCYLISMYNNIKDINDDY